MARTKAFCLVHDNVMSQLPDSIQVNFLPAGGQGGGQLIGGYSWVGKIGVWNAVLLTTTDARLDAVEAAAGNNALVLVRMTTDVRGELDIDINAPALTKLNTWLTNRGYATETNAPTRVILRQLFRRFLPDFTPEQVDVN